MHVTYMAKMIQIRHVPDRVHRRLRARAAEAGMSLSDFLNEELARIAEQMTPEEIRARLRELGPVRITEDYEPPEVTIRRLRGPIPPE
jgi:antitoxin FitA